MLKTTIPANITIANGVKTGLKWGFTAKNARQYKLTTSIDVVNLYWNTDLCGIIFYIAYMPYII